MQLFFRCKATGLTSPALQGWAFVGSRTCGCGVTVQSSDYWSHWDKVHREPPKKLKNRVRGPYKEWLDLQCEEIKNNP